MKRMTMPIPPAKLDPEVRAYLQAVQDYIAALAYGGQDGMARAVTFDDLVSMGTVTPSAAATQALVKR